MKQEQQQQNPHKQFMNNFPAVDLPTKNYSLDADMVNGWRPKHMKLMGPIPLNFQSRVIDQIVDELTSFGRKYKERVIYLGYRYNNSFKIHEQMKHDYRFKHDSIINGNFVNMAAYFKKFHSNFKPKNQLPRLFRGMNPTIKVGDEIQFDSAFESGNLDTAIKVSDNQYDLFMRVDSNTRGHVQWFNFSVVNNGKKSIRLNIVNFKKYKTLYSRELKPYFYSDYLNQTKGCDWDQGGENIKYEKKKLRYSFLEQYFMEETITHNCLSFTYTFHTENQKVQFAYCPPFTYSQTLKMIDDIRKTMIDSVSEPNQHYMKQAVLCESLGGLDIPLLTITDPEVSDKGKYCILVSARIHPGETCGSHMVDGFLRFVCSNDQQAQNLRKIIIFKVIPMLNPDGVVVGNFRTSLCGKDLNRQFKASLDYLIPEVKALKQLVIRLKSQYRSKLIFFLDFHGHSVKKNVFLYGPEYEIWENNYYRTRIFPKILSLKTEIFRYYSCLFRIADFKRTTARAVILNYIPHCYTIEASTGFYYSPTDKKDIVFTPESWRFMGKTIAQGIKEYMDVMYDTELTRQQRREKLNEIKTGKARSRIKGQKNQMNYNSNFQSTNKYPHRQNFQTRILSVSSTQKHKQFSNNNTYESQTVSNKAKEMIERIMNDEKQLLEHREKEHDDDDGHESDEFSEGGSDSEAESDDIPEEELRDLHQQMIEALKDFRSVFQGSRNERQYSFKEPKRKNKQKKDIGNIKGSRESKGVQMIASLRKKAEQIQKIKDVFVWPKLKNETQSFTGKISKQNQSSPEYRTKMNFRTYLEHIDHEKKGDKLSYPTPKKQGVFAMPSQIQSSQFNDSVFY